MDDLVNVVAVQIKAPHAKRVMERGLTPANAEAYIKIAIARRGVEDEFYTTQPSSVDDADQLRDALSGLVDWVNEGCPDGGRYALIEAEAALKGLRVVPSSAAGQP